MKPFPKVSLPGDQNMNEPSLRGTVRINRLLVLSVHLFSPITEASEKFRYWYLSLTHHILPSPFLHFSRVSGFSLVSEYLCVLSPWGGPHCLIGTPVRGAWTAALGDTSGRSAAPAANRSALQGPRREEKMPYCSLCALLETVVLTNFCVSATVCF